MSDSEQFAKVNHQKWANCSFAHFFRKTQVIAQKTNKWIPNHDFIQWYEFYKYLYQALKVLSFAVISKKKHWAFESSVEIIRELRLLYKKDQLLFTQCLTLI